MGLKRVIYGAPIMKAYRDYRTRQLSTRFAPHFAGFQFAGAQRFFDPRWEREERAVIDEQMGDTDIFVDIGANQGLYTCSAAHRGKQVVAIEPEGGNLRFLLANIAANGFEVEVFANALGTAPGVAEIFGDGDTASLVPGWASTRRSFAQKVAVNSLDNILAARWLDRTMFIKMDVEGFELAVLNGAERMLNRDLKPHWLIETFPTAFDAMHTPNEHFFPLFEMMAQHGYVCTHAQTRQPVSLTQVKAWASQGAHAEVGRSNYLFVPG